MDAFEPSFSTLRHAPNACTLPHSTKSSSKAQVQKMVSNLNKCARVCQSNILSIDFLLGLFMHFLWHALNSYLTLDEVVTLLCLFLCVFLLSSTSVVHLLWQPQPLLAHCMAVLNTDLIEPFFCMNLLFC